MKKTEIEWHSYPEEKPKKNGEYLISIKTRRGRFTLPTYWLNNSDMDKEFWDKYVTAWVEKPYEE